MDKTLARKVDEVLEVADEICSEWEIDFLESVKAQIQNGKFMSDKQAHIIERLYKKACASPY